mgnify:FL=1
MEKQITLTLLRRAIKSSYVCFPTEVVLISIFMPTAATMAATMNKIGSLIAKGFGIRLCADAEAVQNNQKNALFHYAFTPFLLFCAPLCPFGAEVRLLLSPIIGDGRTFRKLFIASASITKI